MRAGLARAGDRPYFGRMSFLRSFSPTGAWRDLRGFFGARQPHQIAFFAAALFGTVLIAVGMIYESRIPPPPYHRDIIYFQQWRADRTDAQIIAQQKLDGIEQTRREREQKRLEAERRAQFKKVDDGLKAYGL